MLDAQTIATVKATIPLLVETGPKLTAHFYDRMGGPHTAPWSRLLNFIHPSDIESPFRF